MTVLTSLTHTCYACPSQWNAVTDDGRKVYIRYRFGQLTVDVDGVEVQRHAVGEPLDGSMDQAEMLAHTGLVLADGAAVPSLD